jgi:hypothetical protein
MIPDDTQIPDAVPRRVEILIFNAGPQRLSVDTQTLNIDIQILIIDSQTLNGGILK